MDRSCKELICVPAVNLPLSPPLSPYLLQQQQELSGRQEITSMKRVLLADFFLCDSGCTHRGSALRNQQLAPSPLLPLSDGIPLRSEEHTSELQSLMRISYAVFCLNKKKHTKRNKY